MTKLAQPDFQLVGSGPWTSVYLLRPLNESARNWVDDNLGGADGWGDSPAIEHRYLGDILEALADQGYTVEG